MKSDFELTKDTILGRNFKNTYELLNQRALKISLSYKNGIFTQGNPFAYKHNAPPSVIYV